MLNPNTHRPFLYGSVKNQTSSLSDDFTVQSQGVPSQILLLYFYFKVLH